MQTERNSGRRFLATSVGALAACAVLAFTASPALAKKKHKKKTGLGPVAALSVIGNTVSTGGAVSSAVASCPSGTEAVGGGFSAPIGGGTALLVFESYRSGPGTWTASAFDLGGTGAVTSYAYCRSHPKPILDLTGTATTSGGGTTASTSAACPAGTQLIGGGFQMTFSVSAPAGGGFPLASFSPGSGTWSLTGFSFFGAPAITAHAYCTSGIRPATAVSATSSMSVPVGGSLSATSPGCPLPPKRKKHKHKKKVPPQLLSDGGFLAAEPGGFAAVSESHMGAGGWLTTAVPGAPPATVSVTSQGICV